MHCRLIAGWIANPMRQTLYTEINVTYYSLQVERIVTEMVTITEPTRWQLWAVLGDPLAMTQDQL